MLPAEPFVLPVLVDWAEVACGVAKACHMTVGENAAFLQCLQRQAELPIGGSSPMPNSPEHVSH